MLSDCAIQSSGAHLRFSALSLPSSVQHRAPNDPEPLKNKEMIGVRIVTASTMSPLKKRKEKEGGNRNSYNNYDHDGKHELERILRFVTHFFVCHVEAIARFPHIAVTTGDHQPEE